MNYYEKAVLVGTNKKELEEFQERLKGFGILAKRKKYSNHYFLTVGCESDYNIALIYANQVYKQSLFDVKWISVDNKIKELNKFEICQVEIPCENQELPETKIFVEALKEKLKKKLSFPVFMEKEDANGYTRYKYHVNYHHLRGDYIKKFRPKSWFVDERVYEISCFVLPLYVKKVISAVDMFEKSDVYKNNSHILCKARLNSIECLDFYGSHIQTKSSRKEEENINLHNFVVQSAITKGIWEPYEMNIAPKSKEQNCEYYIETPYLISSQTHEIKKGIAVVEMYKSCFGGWEYLAKEFGKGIVPVELDYTLTVLHEVKIVSNTKLVVKSHVILNQEIDAEQMPFDEYYQKTVSLDGDFEFTVTDTYEILGFNSLVHTTDASKYYEIYDIPVGYKFEDGLYGFDPKLYLE